MNLKFIQNLFNIIMKLTVEEMEYCTNPEYIWTKDLPLIVYEQKPAPPLF